MNDFDVSKVNDAFYVMYFSYNLCCTVYGVGVIEVLFPYMVQLNILVLHLAFSISLKTFCVQHHRNNDQLKNQLL